MGTATSRVKLQGEETVSTAAERASRSIRQMKSEIERGTGPIREMGKLANSLFALGGATAAIMMFRRVSSAVQDCIGEYQRHEQAVAQLAAAFRSGNADISMTIDGLVGLADHLQRMTLFSHDASESAMGLMRTVGGLGENQIRTLLPRLQDFSTAIGVDLVQTAKMASQSIEGTRNTLGRYGIELEKGASVSEKVAAIVDQLREKFGGLARAVADTATGSIVKLKNALADLKEEGGRTMAVFFKPLVDWYRQMVERATDALKVHNDFVEAMKHQKEGVKNAKDEIAIYAKHIYDLEHLHSRNTDVIQKQIAAYKLAIQMLQQGGQAAREAADAETLARQAQLTFLERLEDAYGKTSEGRLAALRTEIAYWEAARTKYKEHAAEIRAILLPLYEQLRKAMAGPEGPALPLGYRGLGLEVAGAGGRFGVGERMGWGLGAAQESMEAMVGAAYAQELAMRGVTQASVNVANQFGLLERQTHEVGEEMRKLAIEQYRQSLGAWLKPAEAFAGTEVGAAAMGPELGMEAGPLADVLGSVLPMFSQFALALESVNLVLNPLATILQGVFQVLAPLIDAALKPLVGILVILGQTVGKILTPIFMILAPIIKAVATIFVWLYNNVIRHIGNAIITVANIIYNVIAFFYNAVVAVINTLFGWLGVHIKYMKYRGLTEGYMGKISMEEMEAAAGTTAAYGGGAGGLGSQTTVQRVPDIYIYITVEGNVYGPGGLRQVGGEMAQALEEFAGIGGRIHIEEAIAPVRG